MERVGVLINKLQQQLNEQANVQHMLATAQLLQNELLMQCKQANGSESKKVAVMMPYNITAPLPIIVAAETVKTDNDTTVEEPQQAPKLVAEPEAVAEVSGIEVITGTEPITHVDEAVAEIPDSDIATVSEPIQLDETVAEVPESEAITVTESVQIHEPVAETLLTEAPESEPEKVWEPEPVSVPDIIEEAPLSEVSEENTVTIEENEPATIFKPEPFLQFPEDKPWQRLFADQQDSTSPWAIDPMMEIPTLAHQERVVYELNDVMVVDNATSLNDAMKQETDEVANKLVGTPVKDLKKAISINERHSFIQELFKSDEAMYERSIKTINGFNIFAEAEFWIQRELKLKLAWDNTSELVKVFDQVVKRRFS